MLYLMKLKKLIYFLAQIFIITVFFLDMKIMIGVLIGMKNLLMKEMKIPMIVLLFESLYIKYINID